MLVLHLRLPTKMTNNGPVIMYKWVVFLRGVNVGGNNIVKMKKLVSHLLDAGFLEAKSYIQSGNLVVSSDLADEQAIELKVAEVINAHFGFKPDVMAVAPSSLREILSDNPFNQPDIDPKNLHYQLCRSTPQPDREKLDALKIESESYHIGQQVLYFHAPDGVGRSKFAAGAEKCLGVPATARNQRTIQKLLEMV